MNYKFFVAVLAVMMFSAALPTMYAHAQGTIGTEASTVLDQCIQQFQGSAHIYCTQLYSSDVAKSGTLLQSFRYSSSPNTIIVYEHQKVTLSGLRSTDPEGSKLSYKWAETKGDPITFSPSNAVGVISFLAPPVAPQEVKTITLSLTVDDGYGGRDTTSYNVIVLHVNRPPVVQVNPDQVVNEGDKVSLSCSATDPDNDPLTLAWGQYSGQDVKLSSLNPDTSFIAPSVVPGTNPTFLFLCSADDGHGGKAAALTKVTVKSTHQEPTVSCMNLSVTENSLVRLSAAVSNPSGDNLSYYWRQISGQPVKLSSNNDLSPVFVAPGANGQRTDLQFVLQTTDPHVNVPTCTVTVRINALVPTGQPPVADAGPDQTVSPFDRVTLDGSASTGANITYKWEQISGDPVTVIFRNSAHPVFFAPKVDINGEKVFEFKLTVENKYGHDSDTVKVTVSLGNENPTARIYPIP